MAPSFSAINYHLNHHSPPLKQEAFWRNFCKWGKWQLWRREGIVEESKMASWLQALRHYKMIIIIR
ncbi:MAG: hypothetical protein DRJ51_01900 [Thermoprotei archaeon]|nr:MAG: hypothetical protein DRJ51_01900 [Thermoprotei archaeon]